MSGLGYWGTFSSSLQPHNSRQALSPLSSGSRKETETSRSQRDSAEWNTCGLLIMSLLLLLSNKTFYSWRSWKMAERSLSLPAHSVPPGSVAVWKTKTDIISNKSRNIFSFFFSLHMHFWLYMHILTNV